MSFRQYDPNTDKDAVHRIWQEVGWIENEKTEIMDLFVEKASIAMVAEVNGEAECLVLRTPGTIRYRDQDLPFAGITGVTTSRVARKQGFARQLTALQIAAGAEQGAALFGLGMFEQGFYNQLGFGTGSYENWVRFDPARLRVPVRARVPHRITADDWSQVHIARLTRMRGHGACNLTPPELTHAEMQWASKGFGLGYTDEKGQITHHIWCNAKDIDYGPYTVNWITFQTYEQFLELLSLLKNLGDQVHLVQMQEPAGIQLQDLIEQPFKHRHITAKSKFETNMHASAYWQARICDLDACLAKTHLDGEPVRFNLSLNDPIEHFLQDGPWRGIGGAYTVTLGPSSHVERGTDTSLSTLNASVGAFTRMWLGVLTATGLSVTDKLDAPHVLLQQLDRLLRLPRPSFEWHF
ncbi:MAG: GNAT family N-acetyltransferase [Anaerolineae bacterium]|nr:GNAT family N-acetyltransferase [Anaerolineae bacterium]